MIWGLAVVTAILGTVGVFMWLGKREYRGINRRLQEIDRLPEMQARSIALELLQRPGLFISKPATEALADLPLPASVRELLERYDEIVRNEFWIGRAALAQTPRRPGYTKIGEDEEFEEILVAPKDQRIHLSYADVLSNEALETLPTLWHKLIVVSETPPAAWSGV